MTDADNAVTVTLLREAAEWIEMRAYSEACAAAAEVIERQGKALRAVEAQAAYYERRPVVAFSGREVARDLRAALAQTEPQT